VRLIKLTIAILCIFTINATVLAGNIDISGSIESELKYNNDSKKIIDLEVLKIVLEKEFGYKANFLIELGLESDHTNKFNSNLNKAYLNYYTENMDWRLGKQEINWGSSYKINPTSYFTLKKLASLDSIENNEGIKAVKGTYYMPENMEITGVIAPFDWKGNGNTEDIQVGMKLTKRFFYNSDLSVSAFSGSDNFPLFDPVEEQIYPEANKYGIDIITSVSDISTWAEVVLIDYQEENYDNIVESSVGAEYKFENDLKFTGQLYYRARRVEEEATIKMMTVKADGPVGQFHKWDISTIYDISGGTLLIKPEIQYSLANSIYLNFGFVSIYELDEESESQLRNMIEENIYTKISIKF